MATATASGHSNRGEANRGAHRPPRQSFSFCTYFATRTACATWPARRSVEQGERASEGARGVGVAPARLALSLCCLPRTELSVAGYHAWLARPASVALHLRHTGHVVAAARVFHFTDAINSLLLPSNASNVHCLAHLKQLITHLQ